MSFILLSGCKDKTEPERQVVAVEKVGVDNVEIYGEYVGQIRAKGFVEVRARVEGYLEQMLFEEGKRVKRNQPLFKINSDLYQARVDKAKAQLAKDQAQEAKAERDVERLRPLYEQKAASQLDLDNAVAAYESAKANVAMSKADLAQAELELSYTTVRSRLMDILVNGTLTSVHWSVPGENPNWPPSWRVTRYSWISVLPPSTTCVASNGM